MSSFSEQDPLDPDDPKLDYTPLRLSERAAKLGPSVSQGARSESIRSSSMSPPASLAPKAINEPAMRVRDFNWASRAVKRCRSRRCGRWCCGSRGGAVRDHKACLTPIGRQFNPFRHNGIHDHRSASVQPRRRRIEARARRVQSAPCVTAKPARYSRAVPGVASALFAMA
jgi:hypothetical protein